MAIAYSVLLRRRAFEAERLFEMPPPKFLDVSFLFFCKIFDKTTSVGYLNMEENLSYSI